MGDSDGAWNRQDHRAALQQPRECDLSNGGATRLGDAIDAATRFGQLAGGEWKPGNEPDIVGGTIGQHVLAASVDQVVAVLYRGHGEDPAGSLDSGHRDFAQPGMADDALVQQFTHGSELLLAWHTGVDAMKLPESDLFHAELLEAALGLRNQICRVSVGYPLVWSWARQPRLGGDQHSFIGMQRLAYQLFRYIGPVAVGSVDEVDAEPGQPTQRRQRSAAVRGRAPDAGTREPHSAISETIDGDVPNPELPGGAGVDLAHRSVLCSRDGHSLDEEASGDHRLQMQLIHPETCR